MSFLRKLITMIYDYDNDNNTLSDENRIWHDFIISALFHVPVVHDHRHTEIDIHDIDIDIQRSTYMTSTSTYRDRHT